MVTPYRFYCFSHDLNPYDLLLDKIKTRTALYLGKRSIFSLQVFLDGYTLACRQLGIPVTEQEQEFVEFQDWIEKQFNQPSTQSWARIILFYSEDESQALDTFFEPFEDFLHGTSPACSLSFWFKLIRGQTFPVWENLLHDYKFWKPLCSGVFSPFHYLTRGRRQRLRKS